MDPEDKFLETLRRKKRDDLHLRFFEENGEIQSIISPIFTLFTGKKRISPYRNTYCGKAECVYDEDELVSRFKQSGLSSFVTFICHTCRKQIQLAKFCFDEALEEMIEDIWSHYNKEDKIICERVRIFRDGIWEPILPAYIKNLDENLRRELRGENNGQDRKVVGFNGVEKQDDSQGDNVGRAPSAKRVVAYKNLFKLSEFDAKEYFDLLSSYQKEGTPMQSLKEVMITRYGQTILNSDLISIQNETWFPRAVMCFFIKYLEDWSNRIIISEFSSNSLLYNKRYPQLNKAKFLAVAVIKVLSYDPFYHVAKYETWTDNFSHVKQRLARDQLVAQIDKVYIVLQHDQRWILTVSDPRSHKIKIVDFLEPPLSRAKEDDIEDICQFVIEKELFPIKVNIREESAELKRLNFYTDCGFYVAGYLYKAMIQERVLGEMPYFSMKVSEKTKIRDQISWLFVKYYFRDDAEDKIQYSVDLEPARDSDSEEESERNRLRQAKQRDVEDDLVQDWNMNGGDPQPLVQLSQSRISSVSSQSSMRSMQQQSYQYDNRQSALLQQDKSARQNRGSILGSLLKDASQATGDPNYRVQSRTPSDLSRISNTTPEYNNRMSIVDTNRSNNNNSNNNDSRQYRQSVNNSKNNSNSNNNRASIRNDPYQTASNPLPPPPAPVKPPYFQTTKKELNQILQNWHQNLLQEVQQAQREKEEQELQEKLEKEYQYVQQMDPYDARQALNLPNERLQMDDLDKLTDLQRRNYLEQREKLHSAELDRILADGLKPEMIEQLSAEDLTEILIRFKKIQIAENPIYTTDPSDKAKLLSNIKNGNADPFYNYIGLDFNGLDQNEYSELTQWNGMLQQSLQQALEIKKQNELNKQHKKSKRSKSKKSKSKKAKNKDAPTAPVVDQKQ